MCSGSEAGSYLRLLDFVYHSTLGLRVIKQKKQRDPRPGEGGSGFRVQGLGLVSKAHRLLNHWILGSRAL